jgi:thiol-disulfide isomerase/thioredoxin
MKHIIGLLLISCPYLTNAQQVKPLPIGSQLPIQSLNKVLNAPRSTIQLSNQKTIILDFFATWCGSCISTLKHLDSLQQQLPDSLQVIVVCYQPTATMAQFLKTNKALQGITLPFVTADTLLQQWFPHRLLPHEVWVHNGTAKAITLPSLVSLPNIRLLASGKPFKLPVKNDLLQFNKQLPLWQSIANTSTQPIYAAMLTTELQGVGSFKGVQIDSPNCRRYFINRPLLSLYQYAYGFAANRIWLQVADTLAISYYNPAQALYCYNSTTPLNINDTMAKAWMAEDLNRQSQYTGQMEIHNRPCYIITSNAHTASPMANTTTKRSNSKDSLGNTTYRNYPLQFIVNLCNASLNPDASKPIIINETGITQPITITLSNQAFSNAELLAQALKPLGLTLTKTTRPLNVFVLRDKRSP